MSTFHTMNQEERKTWKNNLEKQITTDQTRIATQASEVPQLLKKVASQVQASLEEAKSGHYGDRIKASIKEFQHAGKKEGLEIWRIEKFVPVVWPKERYGEFYEGDSYLVLNTYKVGSQLGWDIHFWIGQQSTIDEYGAAAYMAVQIDDKYDGLPVQHREVQGAESHTFLSYFHPGIRILQGGVDSGLTHVEDEKHRVRLIHIKGKKYVRMIEVPKTCASLNSGDVFVLDAGTVVYIWFGRSAAPFERQKGGELATSLKNLRKGKPEIVSLTDGREEENKDWHEFWQQLGGKGRIASAEEGGFDLDIESRSGSTDKKLFQLSDASGILKMTLVGSGKVTKSHLKSEDVFIFDSGFEIFVWIGKKASAQEKANAFKYANQYLHENNKPAYLPVTRVIEGGENPTFAALLSFHH
eukprot:TRINITY_DN37_c0_g1_i3.p1 TRINITY_DN37_c0_g1~~TRINITY_DN37_c0_g1_i3.p1  ORF type:complete len:412 (-),score=120.92 TRINITY_DN37_c0_g1_i3:43-1278(-)